MNNERAIYVPAGGEGYELCHPLAPQDFVRLNGEINGFSKMPSWSPISVKIIRCEQGRHLEESDSPWLGSQALMFKSSAIKVLKDLLLSNGEILPLKSADGELFVFNPGHVIDALDEEASSITRIQSGAIIRINSYVMRNDKIDGLDIFKLSSWRVSPTYVTQKFVDVWHQGGLRGLNFVRVWG